MVRVKICGVTSLEDARCAIEAGAHAIGFNFHEPSPRYISPADAAVISRALPRDLWRVGVFVDRPREVVESIAEVAGLTVLQFHGNEAIAYCRGWHQAVIKAIRVRLQADIVAAMEYAVDFILADTYVEGLLGGTGTRFDWTLLDACDRSRLILAGGLTPLNVAEAVRRVRPYAVDVASGVESAPGRKDPEKVRQFTLNAKNA